MSGLPYIEPVSTPDVLIAYGAIAIVAVAILLIAGRPGSRE